MENTLNLTTKLSQNQMEDADWAEFVNLLSSGHLELTFIFEDNKNKACLNNCLLLEYDGEQTIFYKGLKSSHICSEFKKHLDSSSFFSPIEIKTVYCLNNQSLELENSSNHKAYLDESSQNLLSILAELDITTIPVKAVKKAWGLYTLTLLKILPKTSNPVGLYKASVLCLALSITGTSSADDKLVIKSDNGFEKVAKKMNDTIVENYRPTPILQQEMNQNPHFDKSRVVNYQRAGNQALNEYIKNDTGLYPALKSLERKVEDFFNGDDALANREQFKKEGTLPKSLTSDLSEEDAIKVETQLKTQILKGQARFKVVTSIGEVITEARAFGGEMFRASAKTKALELKEFGINMHGSVEYKNSQINSAIRTQINPNTSFHVEHVRTIASDGKTDNRVRLNYDIDF